MNANQQAQYDSMIQAEVDQRKNFEALYKVIFDITEMPRKPENPDGVVDYVDAVHNEAYKHFRTVTEHKRSQDGIRTLWTEIPLIQWVCISRFANQPKHEFISNKKLRFAWDVVFQR